MGTFQRLCPVVLALLLVAVALPSCKKKKTGEEIVKKTLNFGDTAQLSHTSVKVVGFGFRYVLVNSMLGNHYLDEPKFVVDVEFKNTGKAAFNYAPEHFGISRYYPSLEDERGRHRSVKPRSGERFAGMLRDMMLPNGQAIRDSFIYNVSRPDKAHQFEWKVKGNRMILERAELTFKLNYQPREPAPIPLHDISKPHVFRGRKVEFSKPKLEYLQLSNLSGEIGWTNKAYLVFRWKVTNQGKSAFTYLPDHNQYRALSAFLYTMRGFNVKKARVDRFVVKGMLQRKVRVEPGKTISDMVVFSVPKVEQSHVFLHLSRRMIRQDGVWRIKTSYSNEPPEKPKALNPPKTEEPPAPKPKKRKRRKKN